MNQHDVVIYRNNYPKIYFAAGLSAFFIESVIATIEVKSTLDKDELRKAFVAAQNVKRLQPNYLRSNRIVTYSLNHPYPVCLVVAYAASTNNIDTVYKWIWEIQRELGIPDILMPDTHDKRICLHASSLDGVYIMGTGSVVFGNTRQLTDDLMEQLNTMMATAGSIVPWVKNGTNGAVLSNLFIKLLSAINSYHDYTMDPIPYYREGAKRQTSNDSEKTKER